jgi:hypothetical protein
VTGAWPWIAIAALGAYHGLDPSMGWLFAVALGLQERRRAKVFAALGPIALGHLVSIAAVVALIGWARFAAASTLLRPAGAAILILFGIFRYLRPRAHPRWVAMRVKWYELALWSFLMASAHGAGLMLFPILMDMPGGAAMYHQVMHGVHGRLMHQSMAAMGQSLSFAQDAAVVLLHTAAMLLVMGTIAIVVYDRVGLAFLRSAWINLDAVWAGALIAAGLLSLMV